MCEPWKLPVVGDVLELSFHDNRPAVDLYILAVDKDEGVWTVLRSDTNQYDLIHLDENKNYRFIPRYFFPEDEPWRQS